MNIEPIALFTALSHPLRLRALLLLEQQEELCVCDLTLALGVSQPMISRHLAHLRQWGLVSDRRQGIWVLYRLHESLPDWVRQVLSATAQGLSGKGRLEWTSAPAASACPTGRAPPAAPGWGPNSNQRSPE